MDPTLFPEAVCQLPGGESKAGVEGQLGTPSYLSSQVLSFENEAMVQRKRERERDIVVLSDGEHLIWTIFQKGLGASKVRSQEL